MTSQGTDNTNFLDKVSSLGNLGYDSLQTIIDNPVPQHEDPSIKLAKGDALGGSIGDRYVIVLVGLPATGKTCVARRLCQYLQFFHGTDIKVFNVGNYRRKICGAITPASFFDPKNVEGDKARQECAKLAMQDLRSWIQKADKSGRVGIYDATNTTRQRRSWILKELEGDIESIRKVIFVESVLTNPVTIEANVREAKLTMPDYEGKSEDEAMFDFKERIGFYRSVYEPLDVDIDKNLSWIKLVDGGRHASMNNIAGFIPGRIAQFCMNLHTQIRPIYLSRHGQSQYNKLEKIGGDSGLSEDGEKYAIELAKYVNKNILKINEDGSFPNPSKKTAIHARLFTSSLQRTKRTARHIAHNLCDDGWVTMRPRECPSLDEIYAGVFDGMTYSEIKQTAPDEFIKRKKDKLSYRYPRGESYLDVINRLDSIVHDVERMQDPILIVGHQGILRILYAYFTNQKREDAPFISIPLNHVIKLEPHTYECKVERVNLNLSSDDVISEPPSH